MPKFTDRYIMNLKPQEKRYDVADRDGFSLRVFPTGYKTWRYVYRQDGRLRPVTIGPYPAISLADAKERHKEMHDRRKAGLPPVAEELPPEPEAPSDPLLESIAEDYLELHAKPTKKSWREDERILNRDILTELGKMVAVEIRRGDITRFTDKILLSGGPAAANCAFKILRRMFNWAIEKDHYGLEHSPCDRLGQPRPDTRRDRFLTSEEIKAFWHGLDDNRVHMSGATIAALRLTLVTGQRPGECVGLPLSEIKEDWWTLPKERAKNGIAHRIYLSPLALEIIQPDECRRWAFPSPQVKEGADEKPMTTSTLGSALRRFQDRRQEKHVRQLWEYPAFTSHDLRRTCATQLAKLGFSNEVIDAVLNHALSGVRGIYNRYHYDDEKKTALLAWEEKLRRILKL